MQSTLKTTILATAAVLVAALSGAQAAQAGGHGYRHFSTYLLEGLHDDEETYASDCGCDGDTEDTVSAAAEAASELLGLDDGDDD
jgi:hypothetical protein